MKITESGLKLIKEFEGCSLKAYKLSGENYFTIGYGHTCDNTITADTVWTQQQADEMLIQDLGKFEKYVNNVALPKFPSMNQNQFNALVSYTYNRGLKGLKQLIEASGNLLEVSQNLIIYWGTATKYRTGLMRRRKAEQDLFNTFDLSEEYLNALQTLVDAKIVSTPSVWKTENISPKNVRSLVIKMAKFIEDIENNKM